MKKKCSSLVMAAFALLLLLTACKKEKVDPMEPPQPPVARAGNDTTIYLPFNSCALDGWASTDPDLGNLLFEWRKIAGSLPWADTVVVRSSRAGVGGMIQVGTYAFELTVKNRKGLSAKDTISITVREPVCRGPIKEIILKDLAWDYSWIMEIDINNFLSYLPPNSYLRNIYIKRDTSPNWETVVPMGFNSANPVNGYEWGYGNGVLAIMPGNDMTDDTPDIKIEYCQ